MHNVTVSLQHTSLQPLPHQAQQGAVIDTLAQHGQALRMVELVEEALHVRLAQGAIRPVLEVKGEVTDRILCSSSGAIPLAAIYKVLLIDCREQFRTGSLHQFVFECRHPEGPFRAVCLR